MPSPGDPVIRGRHRVLPRRAYRFLADHAGGDERPRNARVQQARADDHGQVLARIAGERELDPAMLHRAELGEEAGRIEIEIRLLDVEHARDQLQVARTRPADAGVVLLGQQRRRRDVAIHGVVRRDRTFLEPFGVAGVNGEAARRMNGRRRVT